ncbi:MAG: hypothetical protein ACE5G1_09200 [bacterium]
MKPVIFLAKTIILIFGIIMLFSGCDHHLKWERIGSESLLFLSLAVNSNDYLFGVNAYGEVFQSTDDGATWKRVGNEPSFLSSRENPTIVVISPDDEVLVHSSPGWLYRLGDDGKVGIYSMKSE